MILLLLISFITPVFLGLAIVSLLWPKTVSLFSNFLLKLCLAIGLGMGISSCLFFLWLAFLPSPGNFFLTFALPEILILIFVFLGALFVLRRKNKDCPQKNIELNNNLDKSGLILPLVFFFLLIVAITYFIRISVQNPQGGWDAWAIWNLHAKFLFAGATHFRDMFSSILSYSHTDYPLLLPAIIARGWKFIGRETATVPVVVALIFTFLTVGLLFTATKILRGKKQAFLAGIVLLATFTFIGHGTSQYADIPLGFYILAAITLSCLYDQKPQANASFLILAGLAAGLAGWTKNEGLLFIAAIFISRLIVTTIYQGWKKFSHQALLILAGVLPVLIVIIFFKLKYAPPSDIFGSSSTAALADGQTLIQKLTDFWRYAVIFKAFVNQIINFNPIIISLPLILFIYLFIVRVNIKRKDIPALAVPSLAIGLTSIGYFFVYLVSSQDLAWYLNTSLYRLFLQLWPSLVFIFFLVASIPEQMLLPKRKKLNKKSIVI